MSPISTPVRNALAYAVPELFWGMAWGATLEGPLIAAFSTAFGGGEAFVGTVALLTMVGIGLPMFFSAYWVESFQHKRAFVFWGHIVGGAVFFAVALLLVLAGPTHPGVVRVAYAVGLTLFFLSVGFLIPGWMALVGELFPPHAQPRVLGATFFANRIGALCGGALAFSILDRPWSALDQWTLLFVVAGVLGVVGSLPFLWIVETPRERPPRPRFPVYLRSLVQAFRDLPALRKFILADVIAVTSMITLSFYARAAIARDGFHEAYAGRWVMVGAVAQMVMSASIALAGERVRPRVWLAVGVALAGVGAVSAAEGGAAWTHAATAACLGLWIAARNSCHAPQVMRLAPGRDGTAPIGIAAGIAQPASGVAPFLAGLLIPWLGYGPIFWAVAGFALLAAFLLLRWIPRGSAWPSPAQHTDVNDG